MTLSIGDSFAGRYEVLDLIGAGGMGTVYRVRDASLDEVVALKALYPLAGSDGAEAIERLRREVRATRRVTHRNVCRTYDLGEHRGMHYLTMELVEGESLDESLRTQPGPLGPDRIVEVALQICAGLAAAHDVGVVHRDVKPANVLVGNGARVVLTDFGIARCLGEVPGRLTVGAIGTPAYMAPEQLEGTDVDLRTDLYALGALLYEMATGQLPFEGPTPLAMAFARLNRLPADPRTLATMPDSLAAVIVRCLARDRAHRPASAGEVAAALSSVARGEAARGESARGEVERGQGEGGEAARGDGQPVPFSPTLSTVTSDVATSAPPAVAVLPFQYRGAPEFEYLAAGLTDELIDALSTTRGLRVLARGATARFSGDRDPRALGESLGVDAIVDATVRGAADRVKITARLILVASGTQIWSERLEGRLEDVFQFEELMSRRVAEALRLPLAATRHERSAPAEAVHLYFRARRSTTAFRVRADGAVPLLERCLELAPDFRPAIAALAMARVWLWFAPMSGDATVLEANAHAAVARALAEAPDVPETHLAAALLGIERGQLADTARALEQALAIAPTCAEALQSFGILLVEAGRSASGIQKLREAIALDPRLGPARAALARSYYFEGRLDAYEGQMRELEALSSSNLPPVVQLRARVAVWSGDPAGMRECLRRLDASEVAAMSAFRKPVLYALGEIDLKEIERVFVGLTRSASPRFLSFLHQLAAEVHMAVGQNEYALTHLQAAADGVLADLAWIDHCPVLDGIRATSVFQEAHQKVQRRAEALWRR